MTGSVFHSSTKALADSYALQPSHALLISGNIGVGTRKLALYTAELIGTKDYHIQIIEPDEKGLISIATIQSLYIKTRSERKEPLVIIIDDAELMSHPAQNALLKLLEEPPSEVFFILTSHAPHKLLQTILSRVQELIMLPVSAKASTSLLKNRGINDPAKTAQLMFLAAGYPAEIVRLVTNDEYFLQRSALVTDSRNFIQSSVYKRLTIISAYRSNRDEALVFVLMICRLLEYGASSTQTFISLSKLADIYDDLMNNGNVRVQLLRLCYRLA